MSTETEVAIEALRALEPTLGPDAPNDSWSGRATAFMTDIQPSPDWIDRLVREFGGTPNAEIANSLAFALAGAANDRERARWVAPLTLEAMKALRVESPWPRLNLCTAIDRLLMFRALGPELGRPIPGLGRLLMEGMKGPDLVQAVAALVTYQLRCLKMTDALSDADREAVESAVLACVESPNAELADYARSLAELRAGR